tara:strand:+ start:845 stop:1222 length:378 start_codon:yes stop_codon:yes gene_type:complete
MSKRVLLWLADITPLVSSTSVLFEDDGPKVELRLKDGNVVKLDESYVTITNEPRSSIELLTVDVCKQFGRKILLHGVDVTRLVRSVYLSTTEDEITLTYVDDLESTYRNEDVKIIDVTEGDNASN